MAKYLKNRKGFTLIEVTLAIVILASALVVILGLQSSATERALRDGNMQKAMLISREILAAIEANQKDINIQTLENRTIEEIFRVVFPQANDLPANVEYDNFRCDLLIEYSGIPNLNDEAMIKILLRVKWSDEPRDSMEVVYYIPNK